MQTNNYRVSYQFDGVNYTKDVLAYDFDVSYAHCLTLYTRNGGRIVMPTDKTSNFEAVCIWKF